VDIPEKEQALDFFHRLDQGRYAALKTSMLHGWATNAFNHPETVNDIYCIAGNWVKPSSRLDGGTAASYVKIEEDTKLKQKQEKKMKAKRKKEKAKVAAVMATAATAGKTPLEGSSKIPKDLSHIQGFRCKEKGHYSTSKECSLHPSHKKQDATALANSTCKQHLGRIQSRHIRNDLCRKRSLHDTRSLTYGGIAGQSSQYKHCQSRAPKECEGSKAQNKCKGVGGTQMIVNKVGDLKGFFEVYTSENTRAYVLSFADLEDMYDIIYRKGDAFVVHMLEKIV
jgi:hypothetical protein